MLDVAYSPDFPSGWTTNATILPFGDSAGSDGTRISVIIRAVSVLM
jgi:hypothetical protein